MLVVSRKVGERIWIGPDITLTVLEIRGNTVKLGCDAPANVSIYRPEAARKRRNGDSTCASFGAVLSCGSAVVDATAGPSSIG